MRADPAKYEPAGIFADPTVANWNNYDGKADAARVGDTCVSTWEIGTLREAQATGSIRINGVTITFNQLHQSNQGQQATEPPTPDLR